MFNKFPNSSFSVLHTMSGAACVRVSRLAKHSRRMQPVVANEAKSVGTHRTTKVPIITPHRGRQFAGVLTLTYYYFPTTVYR